MSRVLEAARELFTQEDPSTVTIRAIADRAQVNHALVHRYFGTKDELLGAVLEREAEHFASVVDQWDDVHQASRHLFEAILEREDFVTMLTRGTLAGQAPMRRSFEAGAVRRLVIKLEKPRSESDADALDPRFVVAGYAALMLGWVLFRDFLSAAAFIGPDERDAATDAMRVLLDRIVESNQPGA